MDVSTLQSSVLHLDVSTPLGLELHLDVPGEQDQEPELAASEHVCLCNRVLCCTWMFLLHGGLELHLDLSGQQEPELLLDVLSTLQRSVLHLDVSAPRGPGAAPGRVWTTGD